MEYFPRGSFPVTDYLCDNFLIGDRNFCSLPGPTWPNRFFGLTGTSKGSTVNTVVGHWYNQDTIFTRLNSAKINWGVYYCSLPISLLLVQQNTPYNYMGYHKIDTFIEHVKKDKLPEFCFIETDYSIECQHATDYNPEHVLVDDKLIAKIYDALRSNEKIWNETLLVINYDENGDFYDHVSPPPATPDGYISNDYPKLGPCNFDRYGFRVPLILVSPWIKKGVTHTVFDHTSILTYMQRKWNLDSLTPRVDAANDFSDLFQNEKRDIPNVSLSTLVPDSVISSGRDIIPESEFQNGESFLPNLVHYLALDLDVKYRSNTPMHELTEEVRKEIEILSKYGKGSNILNNLSKETYSVYTNNNSNNKTCWYKIILILIILIILVFLLAYIIKNKSK